MQYECAYNLRLNTIEVATHGLADIADLLEMVAQLAELCRQQESANVFVDHSELDASSLGMENIQAISNACVSQKDSFKKRKCALLVTDDLQFGFVRAWQMMIDSGGLTDFATRLFKKRDEAVAWVKADCLPN